MPGEEACDDKGYEGFSADDGDLRFSNVCTQWMRDNFERYDIEFTEGLDVTEHIHESLRSPRVLRGLFLLSGMTDIRAKAKSHNAAVNAGNLDDVIRQVKEAGGSLGFLEGIGAANFNSCDKASRSLKLGFMARLMNQCCGLATTNYSKIADSLEKGGVYSTQIGAGRLGPPAAPTPPRRLEEDVEAKKETLRAVLVAVHTGDWGDWEHVASDNGVTRGLQRLADKARKSQLKKDAAETNLMYANIDKEVALLPYDRGEELAAGVAQRAAAEAALDGSAVRERATDDLRRSVERLGTRDPDTDVEAKARRDAGRHRRRAADLRGGELSGSHDARVKLGAMQCTEFHGDPVACSAWAEYDTSTGEFTPCKYTSGTAGGERGQCKRVTRSQREDRVRTGIVRELGLRGLPAYDAELSGSKYYARDIATGHLTEESIRNLREADEATVGGMRPEILKDAKQSTLALVEGTGWGKHLARKRYWSQEMRDGLHDLSSTIAKLLREHRKSRDGIQKVMKHAGKWRSQNAMEHYTSDEDVSADAHTLASAIVGRYRRARVGSGSAPDLKGMDAAILAVKSDALTRCVNRVRERLELPPLK